jgi:hypothetical protein
MREAGTRRSAIRRFGGAAIAALLASAAVATASLGQPPTSYIIDNPKPSTDFGATFAAKIRPAESFPGPYTGVLFPPRWAASVMGNPRPLFRIGRRVVLGREAPDDIGDFYTWLGLTTVASPAGAERTVGVTAIKSDWGPTLSFSCATCHSQNFFGTFIYGMSAKTPRAYDLLTRAKSFLQNAPVWALGAADENEAALLRRSQEGLRATGTQTPLALGLDTTWALVSLSLAHRETDTAATLSTTYGRSPRADYFDNARADSKPLDWWGTRYKDRYLADGSLVGGNIILVNFLWNEIGRGTDLSQLAAWIKANPTLINDINKMVRTAVPPRIGDFVATPIDVKAAQHGEILYLGNCASCHGIYEKSWGKGTATVAVDYPKPTKAMDVGTDPNRAAGTYAIADRVNRLDISVKYGLVIKPTGGYVAPPLVGVWSRYPYLHNRSVPNLCELLKPASQRVARYYVGTTEDITTDYDADCVGYPTANVPAAWQTRDRVFDTRIGGLSNAGHEYFTNGADKDKRDLIEYLKTL